VNRTEAEMAAFYIGIQQGFQFKLAPGTHEARILDGSSLDHYFSVSLLPNFLHKHFESARIQEKFDGRLCSLSEMRDSNPALFDARSLLFVVCYLNPAFESVEGMLIEGKSLFLAEMDEWKLKSAKEVSLMVLLYFSFFMLGT
jgi:hypothetical protein